MTNKRLRLPNFIGRIIYYKTKRCISETWCKQTSKGHKLISKYYLEL